MSPLASGSAGRHTSTLAANTPRKAWHSVVNSERPPRQRPIAPSPSHTSTRGTAPNPVISRHHPANRSSACLLGNSMASSQRE